MIELAAKRTQVRYHHGMQQQPVIAFQHVDQSAHPVGLLWSQRIIEFRRRDEAQHGEVGVAVEKDFPDEVIRIVASPENQRA